MDDCEIYRKEIEEEVSKHSIVKENVHENSVKHDNIEDKIDNTIEA